VLYNVTRDFDAAADAFAAAANAKPTDYSMWNKLGATRANSQASAEALPAYHQALALKPR
jgi:peroxin-5